MRPVSAPARFLLGCPTTVQVPLLNEALKSLSAPGAAAPTSYIPLEAQLPLGEIEHDGF